MPHGISTGRVLVVMRRRPGSRINVSRECKERARMPATSQTRFKAAFKLKITDDTLGLSWDGADRVLPDFKNENTDKGYKSPLLGL